MINFINPTRWIILQYRPGAGGKFLLLCLMTIDRIAHWDPEVENRTITHQKSLSKYWNNVTQADWLSTEPLVHWHSQFYSRSFQRGDTIGLDEYNTIMNIHSDEYFRSCWQGGKFILDFLHKERIPAWHQGSAILKLDADISDILYQKILLAKLFPWDPVTKIGVCLLDHPLVNQSKIVNQFKNQYEFRTFENSTQWLDFVFQKYNNINFKIDSADILFRDLMDFNNLENFIAKIAKNLNSTYNHPALKETYMYWVNKNRKLFELN